VSYHFLKIIYITEYTSAHPATMRIGTARIQEKVSGTFIGLGEEIVTT